jgi:hypothetical protein
MSLDQPLLVVKPLELLQSLDQLRDPGEVLDPEQVRKLSRQSARGAEVTPSSRERSSRLSARRKRRMVAALRGAEKRPRSPGFVVLDTGVGS